MNTTTAIATTSPSKQFVSEIPDLREQQFSPGESAFYAQKREVEGEGTFYTISVPAKALAKNFTVKPEHQRRLKREWVKELTDHLLNGTFSWFLPFSAICRGQSIQIKGIKEGVPLTIVSFSSNPHVVDGSHRLAALQSLCEAIATGDTEKYDPIKLNDLSQRLENTEASVEIKISESAGSDFFQDARETLIVLNASKPVSKEAKDFLGKPELVEVAKQHKIFSAFKNPSQEGDDREKTFLQYNFLSNCVGQIVSKMAFFDEIVPKKTAHQNKKVLRLLDEVLGVYETIPVISELLDAIVTYNHSVKNGTLYGDLKNSTSNLLRETKAETFLCNSFALEVISNVVTEIELTTGLGETEKAALRQTLNEFDWKRTNQECLDRNIFQESERISIQKTAKKIKWMATLLMEHYADALVK
jgi:hypothetical protein